MTHETLHASPSSARATRRLWPVLAVLTAATFWTVTAEMLPSGVLPPMSRDLGVSEGAIGMLVSAWAVTIAVVTIPLVRLTLRIPRPTLLSVTLVLMAPANLLTALAPDFTIALVGRVLAATAHGLFWALVVAYVASIVDQARLGRALSIVLAGPALAGLVGLPVAAFVAEHAGWRPVFVALSVVFALTGLALRQVLRQRDENSPTSTQNGAWDRSAGRVIMVAASGGLVLIGHFAAFTYVTTLVTGLAGLGSAAIPLVVLVLGVTGGLGVALSGFASDRFPRSAVVVTAAGIATGLAALLLAEGRPGVFIAGMVVWGLAVGAFPPVLQARVMRVASPSFRPVAGSTVVTVLNLGIAAGATVGGAVLGQGQITLVALAVFSTVLGTLALTVNLIPRRRDAHTVRSPR